MTESTEAGTEPALLFEKANGIATFRLNRPASRNALTTGMFLDMERLLIDVESDDEVRVVVITGTGRGFSSGADLKPESDAERERTRKSSFPGDQGGDILDRGNRCMLRLHRLPKPVIGSINGDAVGIGCSLALATDLRIASDTARLGVVFSRRGLGPDGGASYFLRTLVGPAKALELLYLGDLIDASEALQMGLVNRVVPEGELEKATFELAERLASGAPLAYRAAKAAVYEGADLSLESVLDLEARNQKIVGRSRDVREGIKAFLEKRKPEFRGE
jgi:2-(1,2-epoxy-1,2-dihydrophenyl)acetyl-CoA isomerase